MVQPPAASTLPMPSFRADGMPLGTGIGAAGGAAGAAFDAGVRFERHDRDQDGFLSRAEFEHLMREWQTQSPPGWTFNPGSGSFDAVSQPAPPNQRTSEPTNERPWRNPPLAPTGPVCWPLAL